MSDSWKHHFVPAFYLKQWAAADGQLCQFSRPHIDLRARRVHPNATGFVPHLNTIPGLPEGRRSELEAKVMQPIDASAAKALHLLLHGEPADFNVDILSDWSRFIMSLVHRHPQKFAWFKEEVRKFYSNNRPKIKATYDRVRTDADPPTYADYEASLLIPQHYT
ncbi:MAG: DUF4238 domain-containing protein [Proteobacteria bacterium]|nr:DUF4238 domain-containing protein [Pseudomonadota bacterium]